MTAGRDHLESLRDIRDNLAIVMQFIGDMDDLAFSRDERTRRAVVLSLVFAGEAAKNIPAMVRRRYPHIPWKEMAGMRDRLIHGYFGIDFDVVWKVATRDAPRYREEIERIIALESETPGTSST